MSLEDRVGRLERDVERLWGLVRTVSIDLGEIKTTLKDDLAEVKQSLRKLESRTS